METVGFKKESGDPSFTDFNATAVVPDWQIEKTDYPDINNTIRKVVDVVHQKWVITFARLDETAQNFLIDMKKEDAPQMYYSSTTYNIYIKSQNIRHIGAKMVLIKAEKET